MRVRPVAAALLLSLAFATQAQAQAANAQATRPEATFPLEAYRKTVALRASVRGHAGLFLFDTAGGITLLSPEYAATVGCKSWGRLVGHRMMGDRLDTPRCDAVPVTLGDTTRTLPVAALLDVTKFLPEGATPVAGSIALDLFEGRTITIDFPGKRLILESDDSARERTAHATEVPARLGRELQGRALSVSIGVPTAQGPVWMELDSGNGGTLLVAKPYAKAFGLDPDKEGPQAADFAVAPGLRAHGNAFTPDMIIDGNLGMPFLGDKVVTLDLNAGRAWIATPSN